MELYLRFQPVFHIATWMPETTLAVRCRLFSRLAAKLPFATVRLDRFSATILQETVSIAQLDFSLHLRQGLALLVHLGVSAMQVVRRAW